MIVGTSVNSALRIDFGEGEKKCYLMATLRGNWMEMEAIDREKMFAFIDELKTVFDKHEEKKSK